MKYGTRVEGHASLALGIPKALPKHMRGRVVELSSLRTDPDYRNTGQATSLMLATTLEADLAHRFLMVAVEPDDDGPLDQTALANWYLRFGFVPIQTDPLLMVRPCVSGVRH